MSLDPIINPHARRQIPVAKPSLDWLDRVAVSSVFDSVWISQGPVTAEFETEFAKAHGCSYGVAVNSGTSALCVALAAAKIGPGDRVLVPSLSMIACPNSILYRGATPVFIDSEPETGNPDPEALDSFHDGSIQAVIAPGLYGVPAATFIRESNKKWPNATIVDDAAECHYAIPVGDVADMTTFSFYANKIVTAGEGGMVITNSVNLTERLRSLRSHAFTEGEHFRHSELAYGSRITDLQSALGLAQHRRRHELLAERARIAKWYDERLIGNCGWLSFPVRPKGSVWWVYCLQCQNQDQRDRLRAGLAENGIETRSYFIPCHQQEHLRQYADGRYPVAERLSERGMYLPLYPGLSEDDIEFICEVVRKS